MIPLADAHAALGPVTTSGSTAQAAATFPADLPVFIGHFPGQPLVPGVATLALLVATFERATTSNARVIKVGRCKWKSPGFPGDSLTVTISWQTCTAGIELKGTVQHDQALVCEAVLILLNRGG
jgi:3-hydroxymyristoyl/3-hydroxydecanoyl-(acyl carrier protein) dehydratase